MKDLTTKQTSWELILNILGGLRVTITRRGMNGSKRITPYNPSVTNYGAQLKNAEKVDPKNFKKHGITYSTGKRKVHIGNIRTVHFV